MAPLCMPYANLGGMQRRAAASRPPRSFAALILREFISGNAARLKARQRTPLFEFKLHYRRRAAAAVIAARSGSAAEAERERADLD